jgi:hypothetical protein
MQHLNLELFQPIISPKPWVWGPIQVLIPSRLRKVLDLGLGHTLVHKSQLECGELFSQCLNVGAVAEPT